MVETIAPVVHGGIRRRWARSLGTHAVGALLGAAGLGAGLGAVGGAMGAPWSGGGWWLVAAAAGVALLREAGVPVNVPQVRAQVPESWRRVLPFDVAVFLYGTMLGIGFATHLARATLIVAAVAALASGSALVGALVLAPFGIARALALLVVRKGDTPDLVSAVIDRLESAADNRAWTWMNVAVLAGAGVAASVAATPLRADALGTVLAAVLGVVFAWAAVAKILLPRRWASALSGYGLPAGIRAPAALGVPIAEATVPVLVLAGRPDLGSALALGLLAGFTVAIVWAGRRRGGTLPCGCFGATRTRSVGSLLARNALLATVAAGGAILAEPRDALLDVRAPTPGETLAVVLVAIGLGFVVILVRRAGRLFEERRPTA